MIRKKTQAYNGFVHNMKAPLSLQIPVTLFPKTNMPFTEYVTPRLKQETEEAYHAQWPLSMKIVHAAPGAKKAFLGRMIRENDVNVEASFKSVFSLGMLLFLRYSLYKSLLIEPQNGSHHSISLPLSTATCF
jgi:hypothetical protein